MEGPSGIGQLGWSKLSKQGSSGYRWRWGGGAHRSRETWGDAEDSILDLKLQAMGCSLAVPPPKHTP